MSLRPLLTALKGFPADKSSFLPFFGQLTLKDLGFYVEDVHAMKYFEDSNYPIVRHAFLLENALKQLKFVAGSAPAAEAGFFPVEWKSKAGDKLGCSTLYEDTSVTLCWFVIPPGGVLPLHDHPTMSVWQRVLFGKLQVTAVDWVPSPAERALGEELSADALASHRAHNGGEGIVVFRDTVEGSDKPVSEDRLTTDMAHFSAAEGGGVVHELENVDPNRPALFVDVISPPYLRPPSDLPCTYYALQASGAPPAPGPTADSPRGVRAPVAKGDRVILTPRNGYYGPEMTAFAHLSGS